MGSGASIDHFDSKEIKPPREPVQVEIRSEVPDLARAVVRGNFGQVRRLATFQLARATDAAHRTVLMLVADVPKTPVKAEKCVLYLLALGADPWAKDRAGDTAAHLAARRGNLRVLALLPLDTMWLQNGRRATPLVEAARTGSWRCAKHLMHLLRQEKFHDFETDEPIRDSALKEFSLRKALEQAKLNGHSELAEDIEREMRLCVDSMVTFTSRGDKNKRYFLSGLSSEEEADRERLARLVNAGDSTGLRRALTRSNCDLPCGSGSTASILAAKKKVLRDEALWEQLMQFADPTCTDFDSYSCLHYAARKGNSVAVSALLRAGASANTKCPGWYKCTPLITAARVAHRDTAVAVCRVLLDAGADWTQTDRWGRNALCCAIREGKDELAELLRGYEGKKYFDEPLGMPQDEDSPDDDEPETQSEAAARGGASMRSEAAARGGASMRAEARPAATMQTATPVAATSGPSIRSLGSNFYPVTNPQGLCLIINMRNYADKNDVRVVERKGSEKDVERVKQVFEKLQFTVKVREDLTAKQLDDFLRNISKSNDLAQHGSFVCFLMAHGGQGHIACSDGNFHEILQLTERFQACDCPHLAKKPKMFFIQARTDNPRSSDEAPVSYPDIIPAEADFLVCTPGSTVLAYAEVGSVFVQTVCDFIERDYKTCDLGEIMNRVNRHLKQNPVRPLAPHKVDQLSRKVCIAPGGVGNLRNA